MSEISISPDSKSTVRMRLSIAEAKRIQNERESMHGEQTPEAVLIDKIVSLQRQVKTLNETSASLDVLSDLFVKIIDSHDVHKKDISWLNDTNKTDGFFSGVPSLLLSDLHFGEVILAEEVNHVNSFNTEIAKKRLARVINTTIETLDQLHNAKYNGFCLILAGDLISGILHDLPEFNDETPTQSIITVVDCLTTAIEKLRDKYGRVFVPCVVGNHDRVSYRRTKTKGAVFDSFAWVVYKLLERYFQNDPKVAFEISSSHALVYKVNDRTYLLSHGDDIKGGTSAISGVLTAFTLATMRKIKQWAGQGIKVDTCLWGHFHTLSWGHRYNYISNGSLCGVGQYSLKANMGYEPPKQAMWITAPNSEIVAAFEILADSVHKKPCNDLQWASIPCSSLN